MKRVAIVQARMGSTRLPGKVLADVAGRPMLLQQIARLKRSQELDEIVIATTTLAEDEPLVSLARTAEVRWFRGSADDVLSRYLGAAREAKAEVVVRSTADCPLIDPDVSDRVIRGLETAEGGCDYVSNTVDRSWPRGLDTEVLHMDVLERVARYASSRPAKEHVTWFIHRERPDLFVIRQIRQADDDSDLRWTVDTPDDLELVRSIYREFNLADGTLPYAELVRRVRANPAMLAMNAHIRQKES